MRILACALACAALAAAGGGPENVLVVQNDLCPDSVEVTRAYVTKRGIPKHHVVHVEIPSGKPRPAKKDPKKKDPTPIQDDGWDAFESFASFADYQKLLETPVKSWIQAHPQSPITIIALTRGIPVCTPVKNAKANEILRSTTHMLGAMMVEEDTLRTGPEGHIGIASPFYKADESIDPATPLGGKWAIYSATILDAFSASDVKKGIDLSIVSDGKRPDGTVYLGISKQGDPRGMYNPSFPKVEEFARGVGLKAEQVPHAENQILLEGKRDVAMYLYGQANWNEAFPAKNTYQPGCLVDNLTSVALTWRAFIDPPGGGQTQMTYFLRAGATVVHGCVREPTTGAWDPEYMHAQRFLAGYNVAESFTMAHPWFPWMNLVAGDPLTQPFAKRPEVKAELTGAKEAWALKIAGKATREGAGLKEIAVWIDGVKAGTAKEGEDYALPKEFDPSVNEWKVVATDDSKFRTQASVSGTARKAESTKVTAKLDGYFKGSATIKLGHSGPAPIVTWVAPGAKERTGTLRSARFAIVFEDDSVAHTVELWVLNAKGDGPVVLTVEVPAKKK
jgi:uncharacterized protein (TIGR03790 family)